MKKLLAGLLALGLIPTVNAEIVKMTKFTKDQERQIEQQLSEGSGDYVAFSTNKGALWVYIESPAMSVLHNSKIGECYNITDNDGLLNAKKVNCSANKAPKKMTQNQINSCVDKWTNAYKKEAGPDAIVRMDMLDEWESWCKKGKQP